MFERELEDAFYGRGSPAEDEHSERRLGVFEDFEFAHTHS